MLTFMLSQGVPSLPGAWDPHRHAERSAASGQYSTRFLAALELVAALKAVGIVRFADDLVEKSLLDSGEFIEFTFACDELGLVFAKESEQLLFGEVIGESDDTDSLQREDEFECGDRIQFRFIGSFDDFGVVVTDNGRVVD